MFRTLYKASVVLLLIWLPVVGQTEASKNDSITGRVVDQSGQPLPNARVSVVPAQGGRPSGRTYTDREGSFKVTGLDPVPYRVHADMPAYILSTEEPQFGPSARQYKVGDSVKFVFIKGGVITGAVTTANGDSVIGIGVRARMVRNQKDQRLTTTTTQREGKTDDRGVYRIYGLPAGTYVVSAGGDGDYSHGPLGAFDNFLPTYAPSASTRDSAAEISVRSGEESNNVDITFRGEMGRTISGTMSGPGIEGGFTVNLTTAGPAGSQTNVSRFIQPGTSQFMFPGIAEGDYYLTAHSYSQGRELLLSEPKLIRLRGADIDDVELTVTSLGSISGRVLLEESKVSECQGKQPPEFKEMSISAWHRDNEAARNQPQFIWSMGAPVAPDAQGNFTIRNLAASQYYFVARFPARSWYLKSIAISPPATARDRKPTDVTRVWTTITTRDKLSGLIVTIAQGAASLEGQVVVGEGEMRPEKLLVYLVPSEREAADELLRFYGGPVSEDGKIGLHNLAPGRYWLFLQPASDNPPLTKMRVPDETETRARLRRDGEAGKVEIEVKPCQSVTDFKLPLK
ncbi:MAG TPA: carboxypeptidase-like regulatory domain-containing protein [Pyrinomonadaceae bacterium]|nr:carboxypeptidase-like regulatory domain-containing protein [Pyrinomonadaceae bacterium]